MSSIKRSTQRTSKFWIFTYNNYCDDGIKEMEDTLGNEEYVTYAIAAREVGESGTPHVQGYIEWANIKSLQAIKSMGEVFKRMHLEIRKGKREQAINYCKKDGEYKEFGEIPEPGTKKKLTNQEIRDIALEGGSRAVASNPLATMQNIKFARLLLEEMEPQRDSATEITVYWYYGATGIGKSRRAYYEACKEFGQEEVYRKADNSKWFNGYDRHKAVIIDDYRDSWWYFTEILRLLDRYPTMVEIKGGMRQWVPHKIWVTSSKSPREMYPNIGEDIQQLVRRCTKIEELVFNWEEPQEPKEYNYVEPLPQIPLWDCFPESNPQSPASLQGDDLDHAQFY